MFTHSQNTLCCTGLSYFSFLKYLSLLQKSSKSKLLLYVKPLSHPVRRQDQHSRVSYHVSRAAAGEPTPCQRGQFASHLQTSVYQTNQSNAQTHASPDPFLNNLH